MQLSFLEKLLIYEYGGDDAEKTSLSMFDHYINSADEETQIAFDELGKKLSSMGKDEYPDIYEEIRTEVGSVVHALEFVNGYESSRARRKAYATEAGHIAFSDVE